MRRLETGGAHPHGIEIAKALISIQHQQIALSSPEVRSHVQRTGRLWVVIGVATEHKPPVNRQRRPSSGSNPRKHDPACARMECAGILTRGKWNGMKVVTRGTVRNGVITVHDPLPLPDGTEVTVSIEADEALGTPVSDEQVAEFASLSFHGMWADRDDMSDSVTWVHKVRKQ